MESGACFPLPDQPSRDHLEASLAHLCGQSGWLLGALSTTLLPPNGNTTSGLGWRNHCNFSFLPWVQGRGCPSTD
jgi:hypothetical protein